MAVVVRRPRGARLAPISPALFEPFGESWLRLSLKPIEVGAPRPRFPQVVVMEEARTLEGAVAVEIEFDQMRRSSLVALA